MHFINTSDLVDFNWRFLEPYCDDPSITWEAHIGRPRGLLERVIRRPDVARWRAAFQAARHARTSARNAVLVSHLPRMSGATNIMRRRMCPDIPHIAFAFNFTDLPTGLDKSRLQRSLAGIDEFVVFSSFERSLYSDYFEFPADRFRYQPWSMDKPRPGTENPVADLGEYLCSIGGEGRDYDLLSCAMRQLPSIRMVVIARPHSISGISFPENVTVFTNLPSPMTWRVAQDSQGIVIPLKTNETVCGHITIVGAQLMGLPMAATRSRGVDDYIQDGENAIAVDSGDLNGLGQAIQQLADDRDVAAQLGETARSRAEVRNSIAIWVGYFREKSREFSDASAAS